LQQQEKQQILTQELEKLRIDLENTQQSLEANEFALRAVKQSFEASLYKFQNGSIDFAAFLVMKNNLFKAESESLQAKYIFFMKTKILEAFQQSGSQ